MAVSKATLGILQDHYPERLGQMFIANPPMLFSTFWSCISPFIDPITRAKVVFLKGGTDGQKQLQEFVDPGQLNASFGGTAKEFDPESYFPGGLTDEARAERARFMATL
jgi:hypothetical protein